MGVELRYVFLSTRATATDCSLLVGANNHRQFLLFVTTLVIGIILFDYLSYECKLHSIYHVFLLTIDPSFHHRSTRDNSQRLLTHPLRPSIQGFIPPLYYVVVYSPTHLDNCTPRDTILASCPSTHHF